MASSPVPSVAIKPSYEAYSTSVTDGSKRPNALGIQKQRLRARVVPTPDSQELHKGSRLFKLHSTTSLLEVKHPLQGGPCAQFCLSPLLQAVLMFPSQRHLRLLWMLCLPPVTQVAGVC